MDSDDCHRQKIDWNTTMRLDGGPRDTFIRPTPFQNVQRVSPAIGSVVFYTTQCFWFLAWLQNIICIAFRKTIRAVVRFLIFLSFLFFIYNFCDTRPVGRPPQCSRIPTLRIKLYIIIILSSTRRRVRLRFIDYITKVWETMRFFSVHTGISYWA